MEETQRITFQEDNNETQLAQLDCRKSALDQQRTDHGESEN